MISLFKKTVLLKKFMIPSYLVSLHVWFKFGIVSIVSSLSQNKILINNLFHNNHLEIRRHMIGILLFALLLKRHYNDVPIALYLFTTLDLTHNINKPICFNCLKVYISQLFVKIRNHKGWTWKITQI